MCISLINIFFHPHEKYSICLVLCVHLVMLFAETFAGWPSHHSPINYIAILMIYLPILCILYAAWRNKSRLATLEGLEFDYIIPVLTLFFTHAAPTFWHHVIDDN